jgi:hypothetical protein
MASRVESQRGSVGAMNLTKSCRGLARRHGGWACRTVALEGVALPQVVKAWSTLELEMHPAANRNHPPDQPLPVGTIARLRERHEVLDLAHALRGEEARDQHIAVREVRLLGCPARDRGPKPIASAALSVEDRREHAWRVEAGTAVPVDRPLGPNQGDRVQVADEPVLCDWQIAAHAASSPIRRLAVHGARARTPGSRGRRSRNRPDDRSS